MLWGGTSDPASSRNRAHEAVELTLTEPSDLPAATANDTFVGVVGNHDIADAKSLDRHLFDFCRLRASAALNDLLDHCSGGLARFVLPVIMAAAECETILAPDDLRPHLEADGCQ